MVRLSTHKRTSTKWSVANLAGLVAVTAVAAAFVFPTLSLASAATDDFSTWTPRKGKMTYERDAMQPEWGQGRRSKTYTVNCKNLQAIVGRGGRAKDGDTISVSGKGACLIDHLVIHKAVKIVPASMPQIRRLDLVGDIDKKLANHHLKFPIQMTCSTTSGPCITVNLDPKKFAAIVGFHIKANGRLLAPLIESRSGGIVLKMNYIEGQIRQQSGPQTPGYEQATAILIHGSNAIIENNTIAGVRSGIALVPTQKSPKGSAYRIINNTIARISYNAVSSDGSIFMAQRPGVMVTLAGNQIQAQGVGILSNNTDLTLTGNAFGQSSVHAILIGGIARISRNVFRDASFDAIQFVQRPLAYIDQNLFENNGMVFTGIEEAFSGRSPYPSGNICRNQPFGSFYDGAPNMTGYIDVVSGGVSYASNRRGKKPSSSKLRKARKAEPALWAAYDAFMSGLDKPDASAAKSKKKGGSEMWGAFRAFFYKSQEPVAAHILFERPDVNPADGYVACLDFSTIYKYTTPPSGQGGGSGDGFFSD